MSVAAVLPRLPHRPLRTAVEGALGIDDLVPMRDVLAGAAPMPADRPLVFRSVGMSWQDLVVAEAVLARGAADR